MARAAINAKHPEWPNWRPRPEALLLDLNPGPGYLGTEDWVHDGGGEWSQVAPTKYSLVESGPGPEWSMRGSPLLTYRAALERDDPFRLVLFEKSKKALARLREALIDETMDYWGGISAHEWGRCNGCVICDRWEAEEWMEKLVTIVPGDHNVTVPAFLEEHRQVFADGQHPFFGMIYADPYGKNDLPLGPMIALSKIPVLQRVEILINVGATTYKRTRGAGRTLQWGERSRRYLFDDLALIQRRYLWIREPVRQLQWTMILATNAPKLRMSRELGFHRSDTPEGQALIDRLNYGPSDKEKPA